MGGLEGPEVLLIASEEKYRELSAPKWWARAGLPPHLAPAQASALFRFDVGHPVDGAAYIRNPCVPGHYLLPALANERLAQEKVHAFTRIAAALGARQLEMVAAEAVSGEKKAAVLLPLVAKQIGLAVKVGREGTIERRVWATFSEPPRRPFDPNEYRMWLDTDPGLRSLVRLCREAHPAQFRFDLEVRDALELAARLELSLGRRGIGLGGTCRSVGHTRWCFQIEFWPNLVAPLPTTRVTAIPIPVLNHVPSVPSVGGPTPEELVARARQAGLGIADRTTFFEFEGPGGRLYVEKGPALGCVDIADCVPAPHAAILPIDRAAAEQAQLGNVRGRLDTRRPRAEVAAAIDEMLRQVARTPSAQERFFGALALETGAHNATALQRILAACRDLPVQATAVARLLLLVTGPDVGMPAVTLVTFEANGSVFANADLPRALERRGGNVDAARRFLSALSRVLGVDTRSGVAAVPLARYFSAWPQIQLALHRFLTAVTVPPQPGRAA